MVTEVTEGVRVSVEVEYQPDYSSPSQYHYVFTYRVTIENNSSRTIQLLRRNWIIKDAAYPNRNHQYVSGCNLKSGMGTMFGSYEVERMVDGKLMEVTIPRFHMVAPFKLN